MSLAPWSGELVIGVGWAALDARLGDNDAHSHLAVQITLGLDGPLILTTNREVRVPKGKAIQIPAGRTHAIGPPGRISRSIYFDPRFSDVRYNQKGAQPVFLRDDLSKKLLDIGEIQCAREWARQYAGRLHGSTIDKRLTEVLDKQSAIKNPAALARELALSPSRLREIVKADYGVPPSQLLQWLQLQAAVKTSENSSSLADMAAAGGFSDQSHFTRRLKQWFGVTPKSGLAKLNITVAVDD